MKLQVIVNLVGAVRKDKPTGTFVSFCPALKLYSQGISEQQAVEALRSAVQLFLVTCYERGQLDRALRESGFRRAATTAKIPIREVDEWIAVHEDKFDETFEMSVPMDLIAAQRMSAVGA